MKATITIIKVIYAYYDAGVFGGKRLGVKPFSNLSLQEVRRELANRNLNSTGDGNLIRQQLTEYLGGLQRVPLLLVTNSKEQLQTLNLQHYAINDFASLHIFAELPHILPKNIKDGVKQLLYTIFKKRK